MTPNSNLIVLTTLLFFFSPLQAAFFNNTLASVNAVTTGEEILPYPLEVQEVSAGLKGTLNPENTKPPRQIKTIVIDAGHGGHDPGCLGAGSYEKHLALAIAKAFAANITANYPDIQVILTRDEDVFIPLYERAAIANRARADLFISIHCNAMPPNNGGTWGTETYVMGLHTADHNLDVAKRENNAILLEENYERNYDYAPNSPEGHILLSMFQNAFLEQSILFAERVEHHFHHTAERKSRGVKQAGFVVLKETAMPSVLVETGFLTSKKDEDFLKSEEGQALVANALLVAFSEYKALLEGVAVEPVQFAARSADASPASQQFTPPVANNTYEPPVVDYQTPYTANPTATYTAPPPPPTYDYANTGSNPPSINVVRAEPTIIPSTQARSTMSTPIPARDRALQPKGSGNTNWALEIGQDQVNTSSTASGLIFCVQLAAAPRPLDTRAPVWQNSDYLIEVLQEAEMYKYQVRNFPRLLEANNARIVLQAQGFQDAFVVPYLNGERISMSEAQALLNEK
jgi:N-acetylmuramoyl-L-alanine amidase